MNPPEVYMCSPSRTLLPPPSPYHPSGSSQCTSPNHPVSCIELGLAICFMYDIIHVSMPLWLFNNWNMSSWISFFWLQSSWPTWWPLTLQGYLPSPRLFQHTSGEHCVGTWRGNQWADVFERHSLFPSVQFNWVQSHSHVQLFATPWIAACRPPCPSPTPEVHSDSRPSSQWCHPAISSSVLPPIPPSIR